MTSHSSIATPTFRAGTNMNDPTRSGFARVSVLNQQDLFPNEGYEFPDTMHKPPTNSYRISEDSPFSNSYKHSSAWKEPQSSSISNCMNNMLRTEKICNKVAAKAIATPTDGEIRPLYSKIANEAIQKERQVQLQMREQMKMQQMKDDAYWADVEQEQGVETINVTNRYIQSVKGQQKNLREDYEDQFRLHKRKQDEEKDEQRNEALRLKQIQKDEEKKERDRQVILKEQAGERTKEFQKRNEELLQRREKRIEDDLAAEMLTMKQHEENEKRMEERATLVKRRRDEKNKIREKLISEQSKRLAETYAKQQKSQGIAESEIAKREEAERKRKILLQKQMEEDRNKEYNEYLRTKDLKVTEQVDTPDFTNEDEDAARQYDAKMKDLQRKKVMKDQMAQDAERKEKERRERWEATHQPRNKDTMYFLKDNEW